MCAFLVAFILGSLYLVHHFHLNMSFLLFFRRRVSSLFPFQRVLLSWVLSAEVFRVLSWMHLLSLKVRR